MAQKFLKFKFFKIFKNKILHQNLARNGQKKSRLIFTGEALASEPKI